MAEAPLVQGERGFEGTVAGWALTDVIQVSGWNRMTGCLSVEHGRSRGRLFFLQGEIVHAEMGGDVGERAFREILASPGGRFRFVPGTAGATRTVTKSWEQLLLESQWILDERKREREARATPGDSAAASRGLAAAARARQLPAVACVVAQEVEGVALADESERGAALARHARYLAVYGRQLGSIFGASDVTFAAAVGKEHHLLFLAGDGYSLGALWSGATAIRDAEAALRDATGVDLLEIDFGLDDDLPPANEAGWNGSVACDESGRVRRASASPWLERGRAGEAALLVANATAALEVATGRVASVHFEYRAGRIAVTASGSGYVVSLSPGARAAGAPPVSAS